MFYALTPRRLETLATLRRLTEEAGSAVHYSLVGARMRISAWTAYDLLLELEKLGLVVRRYVQDGASTHGGRSRILFAPSAEAATSGGGFAASLAAAFERFSAIRDEAAAAGLPRRVEQRPRPRHGLLALPPASGGPPGRRGGPDGPGGRYRAPRQGPDGRRDGASVPPWHGSAGAG